VTRLPTPSRPLNTIPTTNARSSQVPALQEPHRVPRRVASDIGPDSRVTAPCRRIPATTVRAWPALCCGGQGSMDPIAISGGAGSSASAPQRVLLSHTSDLGEPDEKGSFVAAAAAAVLRARHAVTDMAYFAARDTSPAAYCEDMVAQSDVYVGIIGVRYGSPVRDRPDVSYTELEFEAAGDHGQPRLIFLIREDSIHMPPANEPPELRARPHPGRVEGSGRGPGIRTRGLTVPNRARCRTAPAPEASRETAF
jgi:Domain of unknown function (DUF4062)